MSDSTMWYIVELIVNLFDATVSAHFLNTMLGRKHKWSKNTASVIFFVIVTSVNLFSLDLSINMLITMALWFVCSILLFSGKTTHKLFYTLTVAGLFVLSETIGSLILLTFSDIGVDEMLAMGIHRMIGIIMSKVMFFVFTRVLTALKNNRSNKIPFKYWIALMLVPTFGVLTSILLFQMDWQVIKETVSLPLLAVVSAGILFVNILVFFLFENFACASRLSEDNSLMQQQIRMHETHYQESIAQQQETRRLWHDMNNHVLCLRQMQRDGSYELVDKYIRELSESLEQSHSPCSTGVSVVDTVVYLKYQYAVMHDIAMEVNASVGNIHEFSQMDLCTVISNILDNAIEECIRIGGGWIRFSIFEKGCYIVISCCNPVSEETKAKKKLTTSKKDSSKHGIGLKNVESVVRRHGGNVVVRLTDNQYTITANMCVNMSFTA